MNYADTFGAFDKFDVIIIYKYQYLIIGTCINCNSDKKIKRYKNFNYLFLAIIY